MITPLCFQPKMRNKLSTAKSDTASDIPLTAENPAHPYFPALDGLRFWLSHSSSFITMRTCAWAGAAVDIFFVLSGFLITGILWDMRHANHRWRNFYVRRALRIFPLYYGLFLCFLFTTPLFHWQWHWTHLSYVFYLQNFVRFLPHLKYEPENLLPTTLGHLWSLAIEEQFYLLWPLLVFRVSSLESLIRIAWCIVAGCLLLRITLLLSLPHSILDNYFIYRCTFTRIDALAVGGLGALYMRAPNSVGVNKRFYWWGGILASRFSLGKPV